jgi:hypothetical protein
MNISPIPTITTEPYTAARRSLAVSQYYKRHGHQPDVIFELNPNRTNRFGKWLLGPATEKVEA